MYEIFHIKIYLYLLLHDIFPYDFHDNIQHFYMDLQQLKQDRYMSILIVKLKFKLKKKSELVT
jgi:hypothetical protein